MHCADNVIKTKGTACKLRVNQELALPSTSQKISNIKLDAYFFEENHQNESNTIQYDNVTTIDFTKLNCLFQILSP